MMKTFRDIFLALSLTMGMLMNISCSSIDEEQSATSAVESNELTQAVGEVNNNMAGLDFKDLEPLGTAMVTRGDDNDVLAAFKEKVSQLINLLRGDFTLSLPYGQRFSYQSFNDVLDLSWEISGTLEAGREDNIFFLGKHSNGKGQAVFTASDGTVYTIDAETEKDTGIYRWNFNTTGARQLTIMKGDELVLKIVSGFEQNRPVWMPLILKGDSMTGELFYHDYDISLSYNKESTHERKIELSYAKTDSTTPLLTMTTTLTDDADIIKWITSDINVEADFNVNAMDNMIAIEGKSYDVSYLVANGIKLAKCIKEGTTEEECNSLANDFNANLKLKLFIAKSEVGDLFMASIYNAEQNCYKPTLLINAPSMGLENYPITQILESLGISLEDLLKTASEIDL